MLQNKGQLMLSTASDSKTHQGHATVSSPSTVRVLKKSSGDKPPDDAFCYFYISV
jgi:hypothetical protein